ncbi:C40 family peptidase [Lutispora thermophila]|uniref:Cell wall-associated hydrolase, NlpC family n=1 Tax=Lutispora thermophila DSM 19022 TaxID=1122184 RepID=A0A1M6BNL0_9FIRM|nr:peptidoglycan-binding protein [Lutispora thermophila]SHI50266.1 Cell wall-associated hydrolase, NlpC family [Lutispora thermophila DSM 19022]
MKKLVLATALFVFCLGTNSYADLGDMTLKPGMTHKDIAELQQKLDILGYFDYYEYTNYYGDKTEAAVRKFQEEYGLKVDGIAGKQTISYIKAKVKQIQLAKEKEEAEKQLAASIQQNLKSLGLYTGDITSVIDEATKEAIKAFQEKEGLDVTGEADDNTIARLNELFPKPVEEEKSTSLVSSRAFVDFTRKYLGKPYVYGASTGKAFDCSGFTTYVMKNYGIKLERTASQQFKKGTPVAKEDLKPGDLVFFSANGKTIGHVGIYIGDHKFIHASSSKKQVVISDLRTYGDKYQGARRYIELNYEEELEGEKKK